MRLGVFIPGRLGSERLPNKLILPLGDTCLWDIACKKLNMLPDKYNKYVLCYDKELIKIAEKYPNIKIIKRDKKTAEVDGPLKFIFKDLKDVPDTHLMFLNPCLSFLTVETIIRALEEFENKNMDYATSVKKLQNWIFDEECNPLINIDYKRLSTKEIKPIWQAAHCFHIFNKEKFFNDGLMLKPGHGLIEVAYNETIDVDTLEDYEFVKWKWEKQTKNIKKGKKKYVIDIDNTICRTEGLDYKNAEPIYERIEKFNKLYDEGNIIWYQTSRGYVTGIDWREVTEKQLKEWGVKYHKLLFDKPDADVYIDDKASNIKEWD